MVKLTDIAEQNGFNISDFSTWAQLANGIKKNLLNTAIDDNDVPRAIEMYKQFKKEIEAVENAQAKRAADAEKAKAELVAAQAVAAAKAAEEKRRKDDAIASMLVTSGFSFEGYSIVRYSGYISGDDVIQINRGDLFVNAGQNLTNALVLIRIQALKELKEAAYDLGCNAIIGVDFDYITFEPQTANSSGGTTYHPYVVCVTANGNAVVIEKNS